MWERDIRRGHGQRRNVTGSVNTAQYAGASKVNPYCVGKFFEMNDLKKIKQHMDSHGVGCVVVKDHVAISITWRSEGVDGKVRRMETTRRASSFSEACSIVGCHCDDVDCNGADCNGADCTGREENAA